MVTRQIDSKFGITESGKLVKLSNLEEIPLDEPLFLLRGRDRLALPLLKIYEQLSQVDNCNDYHFNKLSNAIEQFAQFLLKNPHKMKQPSITRGK